MQIVNETRGTLLGRSVRLADTVWARLRGYLFRPPPRAGEGMLLTPCNAIHTWGMRFPLDVIHLDAGGRVLEVSKSLTPWKTSGRVVNGRYVLEVPVGTVEATGTAVGDICSWTRPTTASHRLKEI
ncbi:MAG TPA: DUF192 domain-containing protein [Longimicrobiales bacterium]|nr:DUF192 domain-containing protein [Longimicrobiales bacterium]